MRPQFITKLSRIGLRTAGFSRCYGCIPITDNDGERNATPHPYSNRALRNHRNSACRACSGECRILRQRARTKSHANGDNGPKTSYRFRAESSRKHVSFCYHYGAGRSRGERKPLRKRLKAGRRKQASIGEEIRH